MKNYSVLLLYPDYMNDSGNETYLSWEKASNPDKAIAQAQKYVAIENDIENPDDFKVIMVAKGHIQCVQHSF